jgi:hypothetical protein
MKEYKKDGWKVYGTSRSFEVALLNHYDKLNSLGESGTEVLGSASKFISKNLGHREAVTNACIDYAQKAGGLVKGRIVSDMASNGKSPDAEFDKFYGAFEELVQQELKGELKESYSVIRENSDKTFEMETYFIVDVDAVSRAVVHAYENAAKESEAAQKYAGQVSDFIKDGFKDIQE